MNIQTCHITSIRCLCGTRHSVARIRKEWTHGLQDQWVGNGNGFEDEDTNQGTTVFSKAGAGYLKGDTIAILGQFLAQQCQFGGP